MVNVLSIARIVVIGCRVADSAAHNSTDKSTCGSVVTTVDFCTNDTTNNSPKERACHITTIRIVIVRMAIVVTIMVMEARAIIAIVIVIMIVRPGPMCTAMIMPSQVRPVAKIAAIVIASIKAAIIGPEIIIVAKTKANPWASEIVTKPEEGIVAEPTVPIVVPIIVAPIVAAHMGLVWVSTAVRIAVAVSATVAVAVNPGIACVPARGPRVKPRCIVIIIAPSPAPL